MTTEFSQTILDTVKNGALVVSGSRSLYGTKFHWFGEKVYELVEERDWATIVGDARGVDTIVINTIEFYKAPLVILGCEAVGKIRADHHPLYAHTQLIKGGNHLSCYVVRDKALAHLALEAKEHGFIGLWDGQSKGTRHTANYCKKVGIAGMILNPDGKVIERWKK